MSRLTELMAELCPDGVEYKPLSKIVSKLVDGMHNLPKGLTTSGKYPVLSAKNIKNGNIDMSSEKWADDEIFARENLRTRIQEGDVLLTIVGTIGRTAVVPKTQGMLFQRSVCIMTPDDSKIISGFLRFALDSSKVQDWMHKNARVGAQPGIYLKQIEKLLIPVPPLEVQAEIVRILDKWSDTHTGLIALLTRELELRKEQYSYYLDKLLTFTPKEKN